MPYRLFVKEVFMRKLIKLLATLVAVGVVVMLFGIASDWFTNWHISTWFNGWTGF